MKTMNVSKTWSEAWNNLNFTNDVKLVVNKAYINRDYEFVQDILVSLIEKHYSIELDWLISKLPINQVTV